VLVGLGELWMPTSGLAGFTGRAGLWLAFPVLLLVTGFLRPEERRSLSILLRPRELAARIRDLRSAPPQAPGSIPEVYEAEAADEDRLR